MVPGGPEIGHPEGRVRKFLRSVGMFDSQGLQSSVFLRLARQPGPALQAAQPSRALGHIEIPCISPGLF